VKTSKIRPQGKDQRGSGEPIRPLALLIYSESPINLMRGRVALVTGLAKLL
jgi:hypothetical protein